MNQLNNVNNLLVLCVSKINLTCLQHYENIERTHAQIKKIGTNFIKSMLWKNCFLRNILHTMPSDFEI